MTGINRANSGGAVLTKVNKSYAEIKPSCVAGIMLMGNVNHTGASIGASDLIMESEFPALGAYSGVRVRVSNYDTSAVMTIDGLCVAACPTHISTAGNTLTWVDGYFGGVLISGANPLLVPKATVGPGGDTIPGIA